MSVADLQLGIRVFVFNSNVLIAEVMQDE